MEQPNAECNAPTNSDPLEQRSESRVAHNIRFFVQIHSCKTHPEIEGTSFKCSAIDFSRRGIRFQTEASIPQWTIVDISVGLGSPYVMYKIRGEVRWVLPRTDIETDIETEHLGILLHEYVDSDYHRWIDEFETNFGAAPVIKS